MCLALSDIGLRRCTPILLYVNRKNVDLNDHTTMQLLDTSKKKKNVQKYTKTAWHSSTVLCMAAVSVSPLLGPVDAHQWMYHGPGA